MSSEKAKKGVVSTMMTRLAVLAPVVIGTNVDAIAGEYDNRAQDAVGFTHQVQSAGDPNVQRPAGANLVIEGLLKGGSKFIATEVKDNDTCPDQAALVYVQNFNQNGIDQARFITRVMDVNLKDVAVVNRVDATAGLNNYVFTVNGQPLSSVWKDVVHTSVKKIDVDLKQAQFVPCSQPSSSNNNTTSPPPPSGPPPVSPPPVSPPPPPPVVEELPDSGCKQGPTPC